MACAAARLAQLEATQQIATAHKRLGIECATPFEETVGTPGETGLGRSSGKEPIP
jgi:hypothetical protein